MLDKLLEDDNAVKITLVLVGVSYIICMVTCAIISIMGFRYLIKEGKK